MESRPYLPANQRGNVPNLRPEHRFRCLFHAWRLAYNSGDRAKLGRKLSALKGSGFGHGGVTHVHEREFTMATRIPLSKADEAARLRRERLDLSIAEMNLTVRTTNCLEETGILTVRDLLNATPRRLLAISNFGEKTLEEVYAALEELGFHRQGHDSVRPR